MLTVISIASSKPHLVSIHVLVLNNVPMVVLGVCIIRSKVRRRIFFSIFFSEGLKGRGQEMSQKFQFFFITALLRCRAEKFYTVRFALQAQVGEMRSKDLLDEPFYVGGLVAVFESDFS